MITNSLQVILSLYALLIGLVHNVIHLLRDLLDQVGLSRDSRIVILQSTKLLLYTLSQLVHDLNLH